MVDQHDVAPDAKPRSLKWLGMAGADEGSHTGDNDAMFVHPEAAVQVLQPLGDELVNLISIFGAARQGKSFLMNLLADQQDLFKISNLREPCTQGVDLSGQFIPLTEFSTLNGCPAIELDESEQQQSISIGFVDAEGQGDRDITYDSRLVSPALLSSKAVIFNWKDSLQADRILNLLAVLARAAQGIELADDDDSKVFGHLHIIFRDWSFVDSSPDEVFKDLFTKEKGRSAEVNVRNLARVNLLDAFESITVWLFPAPVANTANLKDKIRFDQLQPSFQEKLRELRTSLSHQLQHPMKFGGKPLTARLLAQMMPALMDILNSDEVIMPESIYASLVRAEAKATKDECEKSITAYCEAVGLKEPVSTTELERNLEHDINLLITEAIEKMKAAPISVQNEMRGVLQELASKEIRLAVQANNEKIAEKMSKEIDVIFKNLKEECTIIETEGIPMRSDLLRHRCAGVLAKEVNRLEVLPQSSQGKQVVEAEINRVRQHASVVFDKLEVANEKAIQKVNTVINEHVRNGKSRMTKDMHKTLDSIFSSQTPSTIAALQASLEEQYLGLLKELNDYVDENPFISVEFAHDIEHHKAHLADEMSRRYALEIRQILSEVGAAAKEELSKEVADLLDEKLPVPDEEIKSLIRSSIHQAKAAVGKKLEGWTVAKSDATVKAMELEKLGDMHLNEYSRRNQEASARQQQQQYEGLRTKMFKEFQRELEAVEFPATEVKIDSIYQSTRKGSISEFLSLTTTNAIFTEAVLVDKLNTDCRRELENQKMLHRFAMEKNQALALAEKEREKREQESADSRKREQKINDLMTYVQKSLDERELEAKQLQDQLREEVERGSQLRRDLEDMRHRTREIEMEKNKVEARARQQALQEEETRLSAAEALKTQLEEIRLRKAELEWDKYHFQVQSRMHYG